MGAKFESEVFFDKFGSDTRLHNKQSDTIRCVCMHFA